jgi:hypothetical protein
MSDGRDIFAIANAKHDERRQKTSDLKGARTETITSRLNEVSAVFLALLHQAGGTDPHQGRMASRELSLAQTKIEEAVMWAVKHVTA